MRKYKKISWQEYKNGGNIMVFASYPENDIAKEFCCKFVSKHLNVVAFNLKSKFKNDIRTAIASTNNLTSFVYIDDTENADIEYIRYKYFEIKRNIHRFALVIDFENKVPYTKSELEELKELSIDTPVIISVNLSKKAKNHKYPTLKDVNNKCLIDIADKILLSNDKKTDKIVLAKNNSGKTGILYYDE